MGTYVQLTRQEFEDWLDASGFRGKWQVHDRFGGVYLLDLSDTVAISINSTTGSSTSVRERGRASMKMRLISKITNRVLLGPPKLMGKSHFKRTLNWRTTWGKGLERAKQTYNKSRSFYDAIAAIEDRDAYKEEMMALIESKSGWREDRFLADLHSKVKGGGILTVRQREAVERVEEPSAGAAGGTAGPDKETKLQALRDLWVAAKNASGGPDQWTLDFAVSIADSIKHDRRLSARQQDILNRKLGEYEVSIEEVARRMGKTAARLLTRYLAPF